MQCAAVMTQSEEMRVPPQTCLQRPLLSDWSDAWKEPIYIPSIKTPQAGFLVGQSILVSRGFSPARASCEVWRLVLPPPCSAQEGRQERRSQWLPPSLQGQKTRRNSVCYDFKPVIISASLHAPGSVRKKRTALPLATRRVKTSRLLMTVLPACPERSRLLYCTLAPFLQ